MQMSEQKYAKLHSYHFIQSNFSIKVTPFSKSRNKSNINMKRVYINAKRIQRVEIYAKTPDLARNCLKKGNIRNYFIGTFSSTQRRHILDRITAS